VLEFLLCAGATREHDLCADGDEAKETTMPHVLVKLYAGRTDQQKMKLAEAITKAVMSTLKLEEESISVAVEDVAPKHWTEQVYKPDVLNNPKLYKKPGYDPLK
jgi:4-oxalocrotonate tautomerase